MGMFEHLSFLFKQISVVVQRFNSVLLHDGFIDVNQPNKFCNLFLSKS